MVVVGQAGGPQVQPESQQHQENEGFRKIQRIEQRHKRERTRVARERDIGLDAPDGEIQSQSNCSNTNVCLAVRADRLQLRRLNGYRGEGSPATGTVTNVEYQGTVVAISHGLLDTLTDGGLGIALLWPFSNERFFAPWTPIPVAPIGARMLTGRGVRVVMTEALQFAPLLVWAVWPRRRATG